jgi:hypothetical protein
MEEAGELAALLSRWLGRARPVRGGRLEHPGELAGLGGLGL